MDALEQHRSLLGVRRGASRTELKAAYYSQAKQHHPDANAQSQQSCEADPDAHHTLQDILSHVTDTAYIPSTAYIRERVYTHPFDPTVSTRERSLYYTPNHPPRCCSTSPEHNHT